jgi:membrane protein
MAGAAFRAGRNRLEPTVAGRVWTQLCELEFMNSSLQFAALFTLGFIPFLLVLSVALGPGLSQALVMGSGFNARAGHDVTMLFSHSRTAPASLSVLAVLLAVLGGSATSHMIQAWYGTIFRTQIHRWKAMVHRAQWLAGAFGFVTVQALVADRIQPMGGHIAAAGAQFLLFAAFWWWSPHCLLAGQVPWRRLFIAGVATAVCCTGLDIYIACLASSSLVSNEASYGAFGAVITLVTAEIGLGVALHIGAVIGATIGRGKDQATAVRADPGHQVAKDRCHGMAVPLISPALALPGAAASGPGTSGRRPRQWPEDHDHRPDHGADQRIAGDSPHPEPGSQVVMTAFTPITNVGPAMMSAGLPVRLRLAAGGWQVRFWVQPDGRTVMEVTDSAGSLAGLAASTRLPLVSIDAGWSVRARGPNGDRQWWALAIGHAAAAGGPPTASFLCRRRRARRGAGRPPEAADTLCVTWDGLWAAAAIGRYTGVRLTTQSETCVRRLRPVWATACPRPMDGGQPLT